MLLGIVLIIIGLPLIIGYYLNGKKKVIWRNLGMICIGLGVLTIVTS